MPGDLIARGTVVKFGRQLSVCDAQLVGVDGKLRASGRGTYYTGTRD
jgi:acyl-coenzyme A thioesterase PaaI-like protein